MANKSQRREWTKADVRNLKSSEDASGKIYPRLREQKARQDSEPLRLGISLETRE